MIGPNAFKVEYKRGSSIGGGIFSRGIKMQVDIVSPRGLGEDGEIVGSSMSRPSAAYVVQFTLQSGWY